MSQGASTGLAGGFIAGTYWCLSRKRVRKRGGSLTCCTSRITRAGLTKRRTWILDLEAKPTPAQMAEEEEAMAFAGGVLLGGRAEELAQKCVTAAEGSVEKLKGVVPKIARVEGVDVSSLANYMAFRLTLQGIEWWGTATNLQACSGDPDDRTRVLLPRLISPGWVLKSVRSCAALSNRSENLP